MSILVTGATGHLGRLTVESLLERGIPAEQIVATGRRTEALADLAARGVVVRRADYDDEASLRRAFAGAERLLLVSGTEVGRRVGQHGTVITAARDAGVQFIAYTSIANADRSTLRLGEEHRATERMLAQSGVPYALLRNSWYLENYTGHLHVYLERGMVGAAGDGRISAATRADFAAAAAAVLAGGKHEKTVHELGGEAFTMTEMADLISEATGRRIPYIDLPVEQYRAALAEMGLPESLADGDRAVAAGELFVEGDDLERLLGRRPTSPAEAVAAAVARLGG